MVPARDFREFVPVDGSKEEKARIDAGDKLFRIGRPGDTVDVGFCFPMPDTLT